MKISHRITLIFVAFTIGMVFTTSFLEYYFTNQNAFEDFYKRLEIRAIVAEKTQFEEEGMNKQAYEEIRRQHLEKLPYEKEYIIPLGEVEHYKDSLGLKLDKSFFLDVVAKGQARHKDVDVFYLGQLYKNETSPDKDYVVILSARNEFISTYLNNLRNSIIISVTVLTIVCILIGIWFSKIILEPLRRITANMNDISLNNIHIRLKSAKGKDEMSELTETFNAMLDRLFTMFETQKNFVSNASHELNTPLTTIIGESEYALGKERTVQEYKESLSTILSNSERLMRITNSLLRLAQTGFNGIHLEFTPLRIDEVLYNTKKVVDDIIPDNKIYINMELIPTDSSKLVIDGNEQLLEMAFANILVNACKYSDNQPVDVTIAATTDNVIVFVKDLGIGIPENELAYIYDPFFRASNTSKIQGYGIGLPLSQNIFKMHKGAIDVSSVQNKGTTIKITLPFNA